MFHVSGFYTALQAASASGCVYSVDLVLSDAFGVSEGSKGLLRKALTAPSHLLRQLSASELSGPLGCYVLKKIEIF